MSVAIVDSFKKIKLLPDGTELVADKTSDTLTLKAGTGVNFLVSADGTAGTSPGQGPVIEIYNTGQGLAVLNDVLKFGNVSNQSMTVGAATIDSLLIDNSQITQTDNTKDLVWRTQTSTYTLAPAGTTPPTPTGTGPYSVAFPLSTQGVAPAVGAWYLVADNGNPNYNGVYKSTASSTTSLTLEYPTNPGVYGIQVTSLSANGSVVQINFASQTAIPFTPYVDNAGDYVTVTGFTSTGAVYNGTYPVKTAGLTYVTFDSGINVAISSGYGVVTKPTSAATAAGTNNTISLTNNLIIASTQGLKLPIGTTAQRPTGPLPLSGFVRYNSDLGSFEGYVGTAGWASLGGVRSVDGYTYITAESTPGNSDDTLRFYTSTNAPGSYLSLTVDQNNTTILTKGLVLPTGNNTTGRPASPIAGMIRYNNTDNVFEGYANSAWASLGGVRSVDGQTLIRAETSASASNDRLDFITSLNTSVTSTTAGSDVITVSSVANLYIGQPIEFVGTVAGGISAGVTYYIRTISVLNITISTDPLLATIFDITADTSGNPMFIVTKAFTADKDNVIFGSKGLIIPTGNSASRPATPLTGQIRFNTQTTQFEGYIGAAWSSLGGVRSVDGLTYITPEASPNISDDTLHFYAATGDSTTAEAAQISSAGATLLDNRYVALRESTVNGTREIKLKAPAALDSTSDTYTLTLPTKLGAAGTLLALNNATGTLGFINADSFGGSRINVSATGGNDLNDGINQPVKTIKRGLQLASALVYTASNSFNADYCYRDTGLIVEAIGWDLAYGSNWQTVKSGLVYSLSAASNVLTSQKTITVNALKYLQTQVATTQSGNPATITNARSQIVIDIVNASTSGTIPTVGSGAVPAVSMPAPTGAVTNAGNTKDRMLANVAFLKAEVSAWIDAQIAGNIAPFVGFTYTGTSRTKCERDIEYIIYSAVYDYIYGGNSQSVDAGLKYWDALGGAVSLQVTSQTQTAAAIARIKACIQLIASSGTVTKTPANAQSQVTLPAGTDAAASGTIGSLFDVVTNILSNGVGVAPTVVYPTATFTDATYSTTAGTLSTAKSALIAQKAVIQTAVVASAANYVPNGKKIVVSVANGDYYEDNPLIVADNVSVLGAGLRSTILRPLNANKDLLRVRNGTYFGEFTFRDHLTGGGITGVPDFTWGYSVAFDNPKDATTSRVGYTLPTTKPTITVSPYIQAVSLISFLGGNGAYVDGSLVNTPNVTTNQIEVENPVSGPAPEQGKSMVANAFTMLSFGGTGWRVTNDAYAQIVSCFQIFMLHGSYCLSGGYLSITNSATNFGTYALRSTGYSPNAFQFDKGYVVSTGLLTGGIQTITAIGFGRAPTVHYVTRFRTPDYKIAYDLIKSDKTVIQDAVITSAGGAGYAFTYFTTTVTSFTTVSTTTTFTATSTANFTVGEKVEFTGASPFGGISTSNTYYIKTIPNNLTFTLSTSADLSTAYTFGSGTVSGTMTMKLKHDTAKSNRDIGYVLDAVAYDLYTGGNQQSVLAGQSYYNAGSLTSGLVGETTQCITMINVARGLARAYVATAISNAAVLGGYGLVVSWTGGTAGTLTGGTISILSATFTSTISGNVLTITSAVTGTIAVGMALSGGSVTAGTYIVGTNGSTWILNQAATGTPTGAGSTGYTTGDVVTVWAGNSNGTATVTASAGVVANLTLVNPGTGYSGVGTKITASVATSIVGKFDIVTSILADVNVAPTAIAYGNASDVSSNYIPSGTTYSFNAATAVNIASNTITLTGTGLGLSGKRLVYSTNGNSQIPGLDGGQPYYPGGISEGGGNTTFALYYDDLLKLQVDITAVGSGTHQILTDQKDFFISSIVSSHNSYQNIKISGSPSVTAFAPGQLLTGATSGAQGYVYSWDKINNNLVVSLNDVLISASVVKQPFASGELINSTYTISSLSTLTGYYTGTFAVAYSDSTILALNNTAAGGYPSGMYNSNPSLTGGSGAVSTEIWLHRPSIVNSSGHTWEYAGSGTDYNALPQNGGQSDFTKEQWSDSPGRTYSSGTNELGDFKVGKFITAENRTGNVSFTNTVSVASLNVLKLALGNISISEISNDTGLGDNESGGAKDSRLSTQLAIKSYLKSHLGNFIDRNLSTNAVPNAVPQLNSQGQLNVDLIPPIRTFLTYIAEGYNARVNLVEEIADPVNNILNGDIATEKYSTQSLTFGTGTIYTTPITASKGATVTQSTSLASGYLSSDVTSSTIVTVASAAKTFSYISAGVIVSAPFNTSYPITIAGNAYPSDAITVVAGAAGTNNLVNGRSYKIGTPGTINWAGIGSANALSGTTFTYNNLQVTGSGGTFYSQVYLTTTTATMATSSITGTTLTVGTVTGTILIGMVLTGGTIPASTYIVSQQSAGAGAGSTWTINQTVTQTSTTITGTVSNTPATGIENNYVLNNAGISQYLILDPAVTYAFNGLTVSSVAPLITGTQYVITTLGTGVNWVAIGASAATIGVNFTYNGTTITGSGGVADIYSVVTANESYTANTAGVLGGSLYRTGVFTAFTTYTGGSGYTTSTATIYYSVALTGGTGSGATADITVQNNAVSNIDIRRGGIGYAVGNTLSAADASLGGRTGGAAFTLTVSSIEKRLYTNIVNAGKISASSAVAANNFIQDNNAVVKSVVLNNTVTLNFNNAATPTGNVNVTNNSIDIAHSFSDGDPIRLTTITFGGLTTTTITYYVRVLSASSFRLYTSYSLNSSYLVTISGSGGGGSGSGQFVRYNVDIYANTIYLPAHGYSAGDAVKLTNVSGMPTVGGVAIPSNTFYYVGGVVTGTNVPSFTSNCFTLHTTRQTALTMFNGASPLGIVDIDGAGSGTMSVTKQNVTITGVVNTSSTSTANWSNLTSSNIDASNIISGVVATTRLGSGIANSNTFLRGDSSWQYAVQGIKETLTPLSLSGSSYANANNALFTGQIRGVRYVNVGTPTVSGTGPYSVTYSFTSTSSPTTPASYYVEGATTAGFNGTYNSSGSSATSLTLTYASNPGTWSSATTTSIYLATGNILYVSGVSSGSITPGMVLTGTGISTSPYIVTGTSGNGSTGVSTWTVSQNLSVASTAISGTSTDNVFYGNVGIDIDKVDGNQTLSAAVTNYTNFGVASFNTTQFYVGQSSTSDLGQVYVKDLVINAIQLNGQTGSYYTNPANLSAAVGTDKGGTGFSAYAVGDILYANATSGSTALTKLNVGTANQILTSSGTLPQWSSNLSVPGDVTVSGNLTVNGITTTVNSNTITVDDKNLELGSVSTKTGLAATLATGTAIIALTTGDTKGLIPGMALTKSGGAGVFGSVTPTGNLTAGSAIITNMSNTANIIPGSAVTALSGNGTVTLPGSTTVLSVNSSTQITLSQNLTGTLTATGATITIASVVIASVDSLTQITASINHATLGAITFDVGGVTDFTANGGGITLKGAVDKTIIYDNTNTNWTSSEHWNIATGKTFKINNTTVLSSTQILGLTPGGTSTGDLVTINATQLLTNKTLRDSSTFFQDGTNNLKQFVFNVAAIGGQGATFNVTTNGTGVVTALTLLSGGAGYAVNDIITLEGPGSPSSKVNITINTVAAGGVIVTFTPSTLSSSAGYTINQTSVTASTAIGSAVTTRVMTWPSASVTVVGVDSYQTLINKTLNAPILNRVATLSLRDTAAAFDLTIASTSNTVLTADRTLTLDVNNAARTIDVAGNLTLANDFTTSGNFALTLTQTAATNVTLPISGTLSTLAGAESLTNKTLAVGTTTFKDTTANISAKFTLSSGTGLQIGTITVTNGAVQSTGFSTVAAGFGYAVNDRVYLNGNPTGSGAVFLVASVTFTGGVTGLTFVAGGTLYAPQSGTLAGQTFSTTASTVDTETALRTYTLPSSDGADTLVTQDATQTLTNKTLTTPTIGTSMIVPIIYGSSLASGQLTLRSTSSVTKPSAGVLIDENIASNGTTSGGLVVTGGIGLSLDLWSGGSGYFATSVRSPTHTTNGATNLVLSTNAGTNSGTITINQGVNGNINIAPNGTGVTNLGDTTASGIVTTGAAAATLTLSTNNGTNSGTIVVNAGANTDIVATANGTGNVKLNTLTISNAGTVTSGTWQGSLVGATYGGTGVNNGSNTITIGGNISTANSFTTSGAAALTLTLSSAVATNATFPATGNITLAYTGHKLSAFAATTSAELAGVISDETGYTTGAVAVFSTSPSFTTDIRTPKVTTATAVNLVLDTNAGTSTGNITIATGVNGNINITPNGTGAVNLGTITSSGLLTTGAAAANLVLNTNGGTSSGTITMFAGANGNINITPNGTGTVLIPTVNNLTITNSTGTLTIAAAKTLTVSNTLTFTGNDTASAAFGAGGTVAYTANKLSVFAATTSSELAGVISDETGTGKLTFATSPTFTTDITTPVIYGSGTGAGILTLRSTSDVTKGQVYIDETTASSSTTTGALRVGGGVGVGGKLYTGGDISAGTNNVFGGRFRAGDGSAANPSFAFESDGAVDTGFYWGGDGYINWTNNGVFKGQFRPDGTAQIGTVLTTSITTGADATAGTIQGNWTLSGTSKLQATYADLAEYYEADEEYEVGTVLVFGGEKEITTTNLYADRRVAGVVSATAAYLMNQDCPGIKTSIALQGRVPVNVVGAVKKGDLLVTSEFPGYAVVNNDPKPGTVIGKAIANKDDTGKGTVEVSVGRT